MRTEKYQIRDHPQNKRLGNMLDDLGDVHNHFLALEKRYYRIYGKYAGRYRLQPHLTKLLKRTKKHWAWIPRDTLDAVIIRIYICYQRFFDWIEKGKRGRRIGPPKFKKKHKYRSAKFQTGYKIFEEVPDGKPSRVSKGTVRLSFKQWDEAEQKFVFKHRNILYHHYRDWNGNIRYVQIGRDRVGRYWLYVVTDDTTTEVLPTTGESVGVDNVIQGMNLIYSQIKFGMDTYLTLNTGEKIQHPQPLKHSLNQLRKLNKSVSRKQKGSENWWRAARELARLHRKLAHQRLDWQWKLATDLCRRFDGIATETLNLEGMKHLWGRKVSDLAFGQFVEILKFKCFKHDRECFQVGQWTPTTKPCSACEAHNENLSLDDRRWICPECGAHHDRDINAAINILRAACGPSVETA